VSIDVLLGQREKLDSNNFNLVVASRELIMYSLKARIAQKSSL